MLEGNDRASAATTEREGDVADGSERPAWAATGPTLGRILHDRSRFKYAILPRPPEPWQEVYRSGFACQAKLRIFTREMTASRACQRPDEMLRRRTFHPGVDTPGSPGVTPRRR